MPYFTFWLALIFLPCSGLHTFASELVIGNLGHGGILFACVCVCAHPLPFGPAFFAGLCCCVTYGRDRSVRADELGGDSHMLAA